MPSPTAQPPERARLRQLIEDRTEELDLTWRELSTISGLPYETIRRVRVGSHSISRDTREGLEDGLEWRRGSIRRILAGGDPIPLGVRIEDRFLETPIGRVAYQVVQDLETDDDLSAEDREELERAIAERVRSDVTLFVHAKRAEMRRRDEA